MLYRKAVQTYYVGLKISWDCRIFYWTRDSIQIVLWNGWTRSWSGTTKKQRQEITNPQTPTNKRTYTGKKIQVKIQQKNQLRNGNDDDDYFMSEDGYSHDDDDDNFTSSNTRYATRSLKRLKLANSNQHKRIQINIGNKNNKNKMQQAFYKDQAEQNNYQNGCLIRNLNLLDAPNIVLEKIAIKLDHDSLFLFIQTNKQIYNCLKDSPVFWKTKCEQNGWEEEGTISRADDTSDDNNSESKSCKEKYKQMYQKNCYNCFNITDNFTFSFGKLCLRVCRECSRSTLITERNSHRLVTKTGSKFRYKVNDRELEQLSYALVPNMENAMFNLTSLYRKVDVVRLGVNKWGAHNARKNKFIEPKF
eukprot:TRINITY_DN3703_c0_g1_i2.p1 TRINITY_DN3703_c0_g1~~TRINITY_DN3703_c0_g1_i2.p1  ORF type:complete len:361 (-),score=17.80 TRINITY_DN3703_c0_g1_i2:401-1483(-)